MSNPNLRNLNRPCYLFNAHHTSFIYALMIMMEEFVPLRKKFRRAGTGEEDNFVPSYLPDQLADDSTRDNFEKVTGLLVSKLDGQTHFLCDSGCGQRD